MPGFKGGRGGKSFGGKRPYKGKSGGFQSREMHDAVCSECGDNCQVPFRPDGYKPVKCRNCFKGGDAPSFGAKRSYGEKRSFSPRGSFDRPQSQGMDTKKIDQRLRAIEDKLDDLISRLNNK